MSNHKLPADRLVHIAVSVRPETLKVIEELAARHDTSRARAGRLLIQRGIETVEADANKMPA